MKDPCVKYTTLILVCVYKWKENLNALIYAC